jgi:hypothetical protein
MSDAAVLVVDMLNSYRHPEPTVGVTSRRFGSASDSTIFVTLGISCPRQGARPDLVKPIVPPYVRHFSVVIPTDAVAHLDDDLGAAGLTMMQRKYVRQVARGSKVPRLDAIAGLPPLTRSR